MNIRTLGKLVKRNLVKGLPKLSFEKNFCNSCELGKLKKSSFHSKDMVLTSRPLELLHLDLFGLTKHSSLNGSIYDFVIVDDFSRFTWVLFLKHKDETFDEFSKLCEDSK